MHRLEQNLMSKNGQTVIWLSNQFLTYSQGQKLKTISQYVEQYAVARGTIQSALKFLQAAGAIELKARGHLGTFLTNINYQRLWEFAGLGSILGLMPLPYTKRYEGLATGLYDAFKNSDLPFNLAYMRGAQNRLDMLETGVYDFAITSKLAILDNSQNNKKFRMVYEFGENSYVTKHGLIVRQGLEQFESGMKIAIDESSPDQQMLTRQEFIGKQVEYVPVSYNQILQKLENKDVDAAVWNFDELQEKNIPYQLIPLKNQEAIKMDRNGTIAVVVMYHKNHNAENIIRQLVDFGKIEQIQAQVLKHKRIPMY